MKSLEALSRALSGEVLDLRLARCRAVDSRTLAGHARNLLGYMLSAYCLFKCVIFALTTMPCICVPYAKFAAVDLKRHFKLLHAACVAVASCSLRQEGTTVIEAGFMVARNAWMANSHVQQLLVFQLHCCQLQSSR